MIIGIVVVHIPPDIPVHSNNLLYMFDIFLTDGVFRAAVPLLTMLSGYLMITSRLDQNYILLLSKKTRSLFIPLVLWNLPLVLFLYFLQKYQLLMHPFSENMYPFNIKVWLDGVLGLTSAPVNYPLNFIRDLFAIFLLSPAFGWLLRHIPYQGLAIILVIYFLDLDGLFVLRESMLISFYLGGLGAIKKWNLTSLDRYAVILALIFFSTAFGIAYLGIEKIDWFRVIAPFCVWPAISLFVDRSVGNFLYRNSQHSFFIFLSSGPILFFFWVVYQKFGSQLPYSVFWISAPFIIVALTILMSRFFRRFFPATASFVLGGR
ncbi:MAG: acyltransferase family protein [Gammaproteobacteria bacterium]